MAKILYPTREGEQVHRRSSIDQFRDFFSVMKKGGWTPIVFDQLDGITCETIKSHPVVISFGNDIGYIFADAECRYISDKFVTFDKAGVEQIVLPAIFGGEGELVSQYVNENTFVNTDDDASIGAHNEVRLRVGTDVCLADSTLPPVE